MLYSLCSACLSNDTVSFEWECPVGDGGVLGPLVIPFSIAPNFFILKFEQRRGQDVLERLTTSEVTEHPAPPVPPGLIGTYTPSAYTTFTGGVDAESLQALCKDRDIGWLIEEKDILFVQAFNATGSMQTFKMGFRIGGEDPLHDARWWAEEETGKPVRPLTFAERSFRIGTRVGSLIVCDGRVWDKFKLP
jgi:hypothetical protein